jgi:hypothetical protein
MDPGLHYYDFFSFARPRGCPPTSSSSKDRTKNEDRERDGERTLQPSTEKERERRSGKA